MENCIKQIYENENNFTLKCFICSAKLQNGSSASLREFVFLLVGTCGQLPIK